MWRWLRRVAADIALIRDVKRLREQATRLYDAGRFHDAIVPLQTALDALAAPRGPSMYGVLQTLRLNALMMLSLAAAQTGDRALAATSIADGVAILDLVRRGNASYEPDDATRAWEDWARKYAG